MPDEITGRELDPGIRRELGTLSKAAAERVSKHLVMAGQLIDDEPETALEHAMAARQEGARLAVVREAVGFAAYSAGKYESALAEFRAARRLNGSPDYLPVMADCERGLGRPERAVELASSAEAAKLDPAGLIELRIVEAGARRDLGEPKAALRVLELPELRSSEQVPWVARLLYTYADTLVELGRQAEAADWFARAEIADVDGDTDAGERRLELP
ncbi:tetratricopeptide repeat protein [Flindersiella endophytica]